MEDVSYFLNFFFLNKMRNGISLHHRLEQPVVVVVVRDLMENL